MSALIASVNRPWAGRFTYFIYSLVLICSLELVSVARADEADKVEIYEIGDVPAAPANIDATDWEALRKEIEANRYLARGRYLFDCTVVLATAPISSVAVAVAILGIYVSDPGKIFHNQPRVGLNGQKFKMFKLRTMYPQEKWGTVRSDYTEDNDPRIFPFGKLLRRLHIDEFPQLIHVLSGKMSLVGPRPLNEGVDERLVRTYPDFVYRRLVKPGCTGDAQIKSGYCNSEDKEICRTQLELASLRGISFFSDAKVLLRTVFSMFRGHGTI